MEPPIDVSPAFTALTDGLRDSDSDVRAWSAQAIGHIGASAAPAVPQLIELLNGDEGARNSACIALRKIGPNAATALPALRGEPYRIPARMFDGSHSQRSKQSSASSVS